MIHFQTFPDAPQLWPLHFPRLTRFIFLIRCARPREFILSACCSQLGIHDAIAPRLRPYPNGAAAMQALAQAAGRRPMGCTQVTEILYTEGVTLVAPLPAEFELATVYTAAVCTRATQVARAGQLVELLSGPELSAFRAGAGFEP